MSNSNVNAERVAGWFFGTLIAWVVLGGIVMVLLWGPMVGPWVQHRKGLANLKQAEQERQILVQQATAEKEAAGLRADAIKIVGQAAQDFPEYRTQEFIGAFAESLKHCSDQTIIYVPTEANIPILEAGRHPPGQQ